MFKEKLRSAAQNPAFRSYLRRLSLMAAPVFLLMFTGVFASPLDIVNSNHAYLTFSAGDLFWPLLGLTLAGTLVLSSLLSLLRGKAFNIVLGFMFGLAVMFYLQGVLLGKDLITLDGSDFMWQDNPAAAYKNLALWIAVAALLSVLSALFPDIAKTVVTIACAALCVAQITALATTWVPKDRSEINYQLDGSEQFVVSENENIIVLTLDQMSPLIFEQVLELDPELEEIFTDFIYYDNMSAAYSFTFPSMCFLLTGQHFDTTIPTREAVYNAWHSDTAEYFYNTLKENGYTSRVYVESNYAAIDTANMLGKLDNVAVAGDLVVRWRLLQDSIWMSLYRHCPVILKNPFCISTGQIVDVAEYQGVEKVRINYDFYPALQDEGLVIGQQENNFVWHHLQGAHFPFVVGYEGELIWPEAEETQENRLNQLHGYMLALKEYFDQLKELGLYDDATIIISADHGYFECFQAAFLIKTPGQSFEEMQVSHAPVAQEDILATILDVMGEDYSLLGRSVFDVEENELRERTTSVWGYMSGYPEVAWIGNLDQWDAEANGFNRYNVFGVFHYYGDRDDILAEERNWYYYGYADEILPLYDSFY